jgi:hypothetical protein
VEVLASIFILGVGMLAVLVLFPLGALKMAKAIQDSRAATIAQNADAISLMLDLRNDPSVQAVLAPGYAPPGFLPADSSGFSYPVFVDPYYANTYPTLAGPHLARIAGARIGAAGAERWCSFLDDLTFQSNGSCENLLGVASLERQWRYTWSWMFKRLRSGNPQTTECYVIVYSGRPIAVPQPEQAYSVFDPASVAVGDTGVVLQWVLNDPNGVLPAQEKPAVRKGAWLFDATYRPRQRGGSAYGHVHASFYKVMEAAGETVYVDPKSGVTYGQVAIEVQPPLRDAEVSTLVTLPGAIEVFERGNGRR